MTAFDAPARFWELLDAVFEGRIDAREVAELEALLAHKERLRQLFLDHVQLHVDIRAFGKAGRARRMLHAHIGRSTNADEATHRESPVPMPAPTGQRPLPRPTSAATSPGWFRSVAAVVLHPMTLVAAVSVVAAAVLVYSFSTMPVKQPVAHAPVATGQVPIVATISDTRDAVWTQSQALPADDMIQGQRLQLDSGLVEIRFASQAKVLLQGPAELTLEGANRCQMSRGKLVALVPQQAHGFTVETPRMTIVDRGTQFGVTMTSSHRSEIRNPKSEVFYTDIQVFQGLVEVQRHVAQGPKEAIPSPKPIQLKAGEAITSQPDSQPRKVEGNPTGYVRELPTAEPAKPVELLPLATWPKDSPLKPGDIVAVANAKTRFYLFKIDPRTGEQKLLATGFPYRQAPQDHGLEWCSVAVEPDGNVLVGAKGLGALDDGLLRIDPRSGQIKVLARGGLLKSGNITGLAVAADGTIYAAYDGPGHAAPGFVLKVGPATGTVTPLARFGDDITGLCLDADGRGLLLGSSRDATVGVVQLAPQPKVIPWNLDRSLGRFDCVAVNPQGRIFVGVTITAINRPESATIYEIVREGTHPLKKLVDLPGTPCRMTCEADGNLLVGPSLFHFDVHRVDVITGNSAVVASGGMLTEETFLTIVPGRNEAQSANRPKE